MQAYDKQLASKIVITNIGEYLVDYMMNERDTISSSFYAELAQIAIQLYCKEILPPSSLNRIVDLEIDEIKNYF